MATTPDLQEPLIAAARAQAWHHNGDAVLTLEATRTWLDHFGLVLFAPRGTSLGFPAPSLVEATLGTAKQTTAAAEADTARTLVARLVGEGSALPLNLLGGPGDLPDFLVSAQAFPFVFTLRGDKGWKRAPETSGAVKVTPLGLRVYEVLVEKGALTVADILQEVGREVTESAVARALNELWQLLRVIPVLQQGEGETRWELLTSRFLKAVKAGANAGQPTALSALVSLYLNQAYVATEEEITAFLSPLTARSRVRDVLHGLTAGRQLAEGVVQGKTVLYVPDALPDFASFAPEEAEDEATDVDTEEGKTEAVEGEQAAPERIRRFDSSTDRPQDRNLRGKPVRRDGPAGFGSRRPAGRPGRGEAPRGPRTDRGEERRPFRPRADGEPGSAGNQSGDRPRPMAGGGPFARPWDEERASRPPRSREGSSSDERPRRPRPEGDTRENRPARPFGDRGDARPPRRFDDRPSPRRESGGEGAGERPRGSFNRGGDRPQRPFRERPAGGDRPFRERPAGDRPFRPRPEGGDRPFRPRPEGGDRPFRPRPEGGDRPFRPRPESGDRPFRPRPEDGDRPYRPRPEGGDRPFRDRSAGDRPFRPRPEGGDRPFRPRTEGGDRPFRPRPEGGSRPFRPRPEGGDRPFRPRPEGGGDRPFRPRPEGGDRPFRPRPEGGAPRGERSGFGAGRGRPTGGDRAGRGPRGDRPQGRPGGGGGGFRSGPKRDGGGPPRPARPPRGPRPEDEA